MAASGTRSNFASSWTRNYSPLLIIEAQKEPVNHSQRHHLGLMSKDDVPVFTTHIHEPFFVGTSRKDFRFGEGITNSRQSVQLCDLATDGPVHVHSCW